MFIVFEGIDGSGKTTLSKMLTNFLLTKGVKAVWTREPYTEEVRKLLTEKKLDPWGETYLFLGDRAVHVNEFIKPKLEKKFTVISDRFYLSTFAYQGYGRGLNLSTLRRLNEKVTGNIKPDLTILLDIDEKKAIERLKNSRKQLDSFESYEFLSKVRRGFKKLITKEKNFLILNAEKNPYELLGEIIKTLSRLLSKG
jgi:dTMP kinase